MRKLRTSPGSVCSMRNNENRKAELPAGTYEEDCPKQVLETKTRHALHTMRAVKAGAKLDIQAQKPRDQHCCARPMPGSDYHGMSSSDQMLTKRPVSAVLYFSIRSSILVAVSSGVRN